MNSLLVIWIVFVIGFAVLTWVDSKITPETEMDLMSGILVTIIMLLFLLKFILKC